MKSSCFTISRIRPNSISLERYDTDPVFASKGRIERLSFNFFLILAFFRLKRCDNVHGDIINIPPLLTFITTNERVKLCIKDVMSKDVITIGKDENLVQLIAKFRKYNYHTLPVIDESKKILGVISSEDIMNVCLPHNPVLGNLLKSTHLYDTEEEDILEMDLPEGLGTTVKVSDIMDVNVVTIEDSETIAGARKQMKLLNVQRVPVTRNKELVGFITLFDIIIALFKERNIIK